MYRYIKISLIISFFSIIFILPETVLGQSDRLIIDDIFNLESVSDPQISPDGTKIIYVRQFSDIMTDKRYSNLWIINFDGTEHRPLTSGKYRDNSPRWSPDGSQIIYVSDRDGKSQIYKRWMDTGQTVMLTNLQNSPGGIEWSPDGKYILFNSLVPSEPRKIVSLPEPPPDAKWAEPATVIDKLVYRYDNKGYFCLIMASSAALEKHIKETNWYRQGGAAYPFFVTGAFISVSRSWGLKNVIIEYQGQMHRGYFNREVEERLARLDLERQIRDKNYIDKMIFMT